MPTLLELLKQKREEEAKKKLEVVPVAPKTTPKKKTRPKPIKKSVVKPIVVEPIVIRKEKIGTSYEYTSNDPELIQRKMEIDNLEQEQGETRQEFFNRRQKKRLILEEMINKELGLPLNLENQYRIETGFRPLYRKKPSYGFQSWLYDRNITPEVRRKNEELHAFIRRCEEEPKEESKKSKEHYGFINEGVEESEESEAEEEEAPEKEAEPEKTEASNQKIIDDIQFMRCELNFLKQQFKSMKQNGCKGNTTAPIERIKQDEHRPERDLNKGNFGSVIKEMKEIFSRVKNACDLLVPVNGRSLIEVPPILA